MKKQFRFVLLIAVVLFALCECGNNRKDQTAKDTMYYETGNSYDFYASDRMMDLEFEAAEDTAAYSKAIPSAVNSDETGQKRMIQRSANISIQVMDPIDASDKLISLTEQMGGFVVSSSTGQDHYNGDIYLPKANLTIRVPSDRLIETLDFIESLTSDSAKYVSNKRVYGHDITSEYVDTNSRLTSLEKTLTKLYEILDTAQNAEEALEVYSSIADVESEIEVYKGQIKYMEESVSLASVEVQITSIRPAPITTVSKWNIGDIIKDAFESLLDGGKTVIEFIIYFIIVVIPILILIAIPVVLIIFAVKRVIKSKKDKKTSSQTNNQSNDVLTEIKK